MQTKDIESYRTESDDCPFESWFERQPPRAQAVIDIRLTRVARGNLGNVKNVGSGVHELKFKPKGMPAYRVYFGNDGESLIILLCGGDKSNQQDDIESAKDYWDDYKQRKETDK